MAKARGSIQNIYNTLAFMQALNPTLLSGQVAYYKDAVGNKLVVGDGVTPFMSLVPMFGASIIISAAIPLSSVGNNGDIAILTTPGQIAQKTGGAWAVVYTFPSGGGAGTVTAVNSITPTAGNVSLTADNIPAGTTNKYWTKAATDTYYLPLSGGTLVGPLVLYGDPTAALQAATKAYVDRAVLGSMKFQGVYSAATNLPNLPVPSTANNGFYWLLSDSGTQYGFNLNPGDWIVSNGQNYEQVNNAATGTTLQQVTNSGNNKTNNSLQVTGNGSLTPSISSTTLRSSTSAGTALIESINSDVYGNITLAPIELKSSNFGVYSDRNIIKTPTSGVDIIGDIIVSEFASGSDFSTTPFSAYTSAAPDGVTFTAIPAGIVTNSTSGNFNNFITAPHNTWYREVYCEALATVNTKGAGIAVNIGNNAAGSIANINTATGVLTLSSIFTHIEATASGILPISIGDVLKIRVYRTAASYTAICINITQGKVVTCSAAANYTFAGYPAGVYGGGYPCAPNIINAGGNYTITRFIFGSTEPRNTYIALVGDSIADGSFAGQDDNAGLTNDVNNSYAQVIANSIAADRKFTILASSGAAAGNFVDYVPQVLAVNPRYAIFALGINDGNALTSLFLYTTYVQNFIYQCTYNGIIPILMTPTPVSSAQTVAQQTLIQSYAGYINSLSPDYFVIDIFNPLIATGQIYANPSLIAIGTANFHPNEAGHLVIAKTIISKLKTYGFKVSGQRVSDGGMQITKEETTGDIVPLNVYGNTINGVIALITNVNRATTACAALGLHTFYETISGVDSVQGFSLYSFPKVYQNNLSNSVGIFSGPTSGNSTTFQDIVISTSGNANSIFFGNSVVNGLPTASGGGYRKFAQFDPTGNLVLYTGAYTPAFTNTNDRLQVNGSAFFSGAVGMGIASIAGVPLTVSAASGETLRLNGVSSDPILTFYRAGINTGSLQTNGTFGIALLSPLNVYLSPNGVNGSVAILASNNGITFNCAYQTTSIVQFGTGFSGRYLYSPSTGAHTFYSNTVSAAAGTTPTLVAQLIIDKVGNGFFTGNINAVSATFTGTVGCTALIATSAITSAGEIKAFKSVSSNYTATANDEYILVYGICTITLPAPAGSNTGQPITIVRNPGFVGAITVVVVGGGTLIENPAGALVASYSVALAGASGSRMAWFSNSVQWSLQSSF